MSLLTAKRKDLQSVCLGAATRELDAAEKCRNSLAKGAEAKKKHQGVLLPTDLS